MKENSNTEAFNCASFMCGVVEGFYGRPWSSSQRKELFRRMRGMGMNTYLYAPKDDLKHRQQWREMYSVEEAEQMRELIQSCTDSDIAFIYAISPGLDISFSSAAEVNCLKRKLDQVSKLGCTSYALLFDDIDPALSPADKEVFQTFGHGQVALTNEIYQHLAKIDYFLFCPTEYCAARAVPNVLKSDYLNCIGSKLMSGVDIMWTGPKVISKYLTTETIDELTTVLRRPPVIWDNIHANDYDQKRLFLGPYSGRTPALIPRLRGVLTNPNCEFDANFIAMHTLAQWSRSNPEAVQRDLAISSSPVRSDIKLERETDAEAMSPKSGSPGVKRMPASADVSVEEENACNSAYQPKKALRMALFDWLKVMNQEKKEGRRKLRSRKSVAKALMAAAGGSLPPAQAAAAVRGATGGEDAAEVASCWEGILDQDNPSTTTTLAVAAVVAAVTVEEAQAKNITPPDLDHCMAAAVPVISKMSTQANHQLVLPSTVDGHYASNNPPPVSIFLEDDEGTIPCQDAAGEPPTPMETEFEEQEDTYRMQVDNQLSTHGSMSDMGSVEMASNCKEQSPVSTEKMAADSASGKLDIELGDSFKEDEGDDDVDEDEDGATSQDNDDEDMTLSDLHLLVDLFYLPYEHGPQAVRLLELFDWLRCHAHYVSESGLDGETTCEAQLWRDRMAEFSHEVDRVKQLTEKLSRLPNRALVYDLYPYLMDMRHVLGMLNSYGKWLAAGQVPFLSVCYLRRLLTWCTPGYKEMFSNDDHEPWMFRGGLTAEFQRMLPLEGAQDMFPSRMTPLDVPPSPPGKSNHHKSSSRLQVLVVRPYNSGDRPVLYGLCRRLVLLRGLGLLRAGDGEQFPSTMNYANDLPGDRYLGHFLQHSPEYCFMLEGLVGEVFGYALAALEWAKLEGLCRSDYVPVMRMKYPRPGLQGQAEMEAEVDGDAKEDSAETRCAALVQRLTNVFYMEYADHEPSTDLNASSPPANATDPISSDPRSEYPSLVHVDLLPPDGALSMEEVEDLTRRLFGAVFSALRTNGSQGVHCQVDRDDTVSIEFYKKFGFHEIELPTSDPTSASTRVLLARTI